MSNRNRQRWILLVASGLTSCAGPTAVPSDGAGATSGGDGAKSDDASATSDITDVVLTNRDRACEAYVGVYTSTVRDVLRDLDFDGETIITDAGDTCIVASRVIPNHDFNDGSSAFVNPVSAQDATYELAKQPAIAPAATPLGLIVTNGILLNGVVVDLIGAACFGVGDGNTGCHDMSSPWRKDPMSPLNAFRTDSHHGHAQPDGTYHYHAQPLALYDVDSEQPSPAIGFAADGFPIYGPVFEESGVATHATSSYRLRAGNRPSGPGQPGGSYDGRYVDDYEFVPGAGNLDECNGRVVDGQYAYHVTAEYPYVMGCFRGTPNDSFRKFGMALTNRLHGHAHSPRETEHTRRSPATDSGR